MLAWGTIRFWENSLSQNVENQEFFFCHRNIYKKTVGQTHQIGRSLVRIYIFTCVNVFDVFGCSEPCAGHARRRESELHLRAPLLLYRRKNIQLLKLIFLFTMGNPLRSMISWNFQLVSDLYLRAQTIFFITVCKA